MAYLEGHIQRMERHSKAQIDVSCNSPSWIGYHQALKDCLNELQRFDARVEESQP
jgi:hypothetical protein